MNEKVFVSCVVSICLLVAGFIAYIEHADQEAERTRVKELQVWQSTMDEFRNEVKSRMADRWTATDHWRDKQDTLEQLQRENPGLIIDESLKHPVEEDDGRSNQEEPESQKAASAGNKPG